MTLEVLVPTNQPVQTAFDMAPRPVSLKGLTLGLIDNGKRNSDYLMKRIGRRLRECYGLEGEIHVRKPSPSHAVPDHAARELAEKAQLILAGIGD